MNDPITIYWSPGTFTNQDETWDLLYSEPVSILSKLMTNKVAGAEIAKCPATKDLMRNVYAVRSNIDDSFTVDLTADPIARFSKLYFSKIRESSFTGYTNVSYNLRWLMFASEPLEVKWTAPYYPANNICDNALFSPGKYNIGLWFRTLNLDWHIPNSTKEIFIAEGQELAYLEFLTDRKVIFQRYVPTRRLMELANEMTLSPMRYGQFWSLKKRYDLAARAGIRDLVLTEIKKNLV